jgi:magnesium-transporting ATPase (P-type)
MDAAALAEAARHTHVFARTSPEDKLRLVEALQAQGLVVAMTGDGVNDAPALKRADAGVAMGLKGSEAAKEAADLVLADDNFATIVAAVREGRTVQDNLRKVIRFELPTSMGEALTIVIALLAGLALPITAVQILWVNLITGVTLGLALAFEPTEPATMTRPPRRRDAALLTPGLAWHVAFVSLLFVAAVFGVFAWAQAQGASLARAQTLALNMLVVLEAFHLLFVRRIHGSVLSWSGVKATPVVWTTVAIIILAQVAITTLPAAQAAFGTEALSLPEVAALLAVGLGFLLVLEAERRLRWSLRR